MRVLSHPKAKITEFGDKQASKIRVHTKYFFRCTWVTNLEAWAPQLECLGAQRAPQNFYSGDLLWGLGALAKMLGSPKGSLKFSLEHDLVLALLQLFDLLCFILYYFCESVILSCEFTLSKGKTFLETLRLQPQCHFTHTYAVCKLPLIQQVLLAQKMSPFISQMLATIF